MTPNAPTTGPVRRYLEMLHAADPTTEGGQGQLLYLARHGTPAIRSAAKDILERAAVVPPRPGAYAAPFTLTSRPPDQLARPLSDDERALVSALGARRDALTTDEAARLAAIHAEIEPGAGRDLIEDTLRPTLDRIAERRRVDGVLAARWELEHLPARHYRIDPELLPSVERELAAEIKAELSDVPEADEIATMRARQVTEETHNAAAAAWAERRAALQAGPPDAA